MRKLFFPIWIVGILSAFIFGQYIKGTFTDKVLGAEEEKFNLLQTSYHIDDEYIPDEELNETIEEVFNVSDLIAKVKYNGKSDYAMNEVIFHCEVIEVYQGDSSLIGREICYVAEPMAIDLSFGFAWGSYANYMNTDEEYLIFGEPLKRSLEGFADNLYISCGFRNLPYFSFSEHNDKLVELEPLTAKGYESFLGFYAKDYPENEFFASTDEALENVLNLKKKVMERIA